ncbi:MAG: hypothetical protein L0H83_12830, partial [Salinisphaera sp.]|nr:hypothetical protein [Salinisphaera sp.]
LTGSATIAGMDHSAGDQVAVSPRVAAYLRDAGVVKRDKAPSGKRRGKTPVSAASPAGDADTQTPEPGEQP